MASHKVMVWDETRASARVSTSSDTPADGGGSSLAPFNPAIPGPLGGTTPDAVTGTTITANTALALAAGADVTAAAGATDVDLSASTGFFKSPTGTNTLNGDTSVGTKWTVPTSTGALSKYNNQSTAGVGQPYIVAAAQDVASSGSSTNLLTYASPATGLYRVTVVASAHTNDDTVVADVTYTDAVTGVASTTTVISSAALTHDNANTGSKSGTALIRASAATSIVPRLSTTSQTTTKASAIVERLN